LRKIVGILVIGILYSGCSVTRKVSNESSESSIKERQGNIIERIKEKNITNNSFFIQKAEIEIITKDGREKYLGNIKFQKPDKYLISIKSRTGIEGARIYISEDSVFVNDRVNKKLYFGNSFYLKKKFGFSQNTLPIILGDFVTEKNCEENIEECLDDRLNIECSVKGLILNYSIDCKRWKTILVNQKNDLAKPEIQIKYENFLSIGNILIPKTVEFEDDKSNTIIKIRILKVELPWKGNVKFIPGKGYELIELV